MQHSSACSCSRRTFLRGSGLTLAGFGLTSLFPVPLIRQAMAGTANDRRLLFIFLRGGNDAVNAVKATMLALSQMRSPEEVLEKRRQFSDEASIGR